MTAAVSQTELAYRSRAFRFILLSIAFHGLFMLAISLKWTGLSRQTQVGDDSVSVEIVPFAKNSLDTLTEQVVESALTEKSDAAAKDAYLSRQTQNVNRQTKSAVTAPFSESVRGGGAASRKKGALSEFGVKMNYAPMGHLGPASIAATNDHLRDVPVGAQTLLNTKEFAYFSFYQRVRKQLEQYWEPGLRSRLKKMFEKGRHLAADREHSTRVLVVLNSKGTITKVQVEATSGLLDLDQAAIDAFNKAGPFPNPPRGLVDAQGVVKVEWEFVLKT